MNNNKNGNHPIRALFNNITYQFENINSDLLPLMKDYVDRNILNPKIEYEISKLPIGTPYCCSQNELYTIHIQENFLSYLWCINYFFIVLEEIYMMNCLKDPDFKNNPYINFTENSTIEGAFKLFKWALSLKTKYSDWDMNLPNPETYDDSGLLIHDLIGKVNNLYLDSLSFILLHELHHVLYKQDYDNNKIREELADIFGVINSIREVKNDEHKLQRSISMAIVFISILYIIPINKLTSDTHPDIDLRIFKIVDEVKFKDINNDFYLKSLIIHALGLYNKMNDINYTFYSEDIDDMISIYKRLFSKFKEKD